MQVYAVRGRWRDCGETDDVDAVVWQMHNSLYCHCCLLMMVVIMMMTKMVMAIKVTDDVVIL